MAPNGHSLKNFLSKQLAIGLFIVCNFITSAKCGCSELRLCCKGRNMSCIALDTGRPRTNVLVPERNAEVSSAEARRKGGRNGGSWHIHLDRGTNLNVFDGAANGGDRFFETLFGPASNLGDPQGGNGDNEGRSENVRLANEDDFQLIEATAAPLGNSSTEEEDVGSGEDEFSKVDWLTSSSKENKETATPVEGLEDEKIDNYKIIDDDKYQVVATEHKEGDQVMIRYLIESQEIPVTIEQLEMLQNYRSLIGGADRACYCDEACKSLGDCCGDYASVCPVNDCVVAEWSGWSHCEASGSHEKYVKVQEHQNSCGLGISRRERKILREALHGGTPCPALEEQRTCYATETPHCQQIHASEVAQLLPYEYGRARVPGYKNNSAGIFYDLPKDIAKFNSGKIYCLTYEISWVNPACADSEVKSQLFPGRRVCVECQPTAQTAQNDHCVGEGSTNQRSTWNMVNDAKHCYGFWKPLHEEKKSENCTCEIDFPYDIRYLFV